METILRKLKNPSISFLLANVGVAVATGVQRVQKPGIPDIRRHVLSQSRTDVKQTTASPSTASTNVLDTDSWSVPTKDTSMTDEFGNTYTQQSNGDFVYEDEQGLQWYHDKANGIWTGNLTQNGEQWQYTDGGDIQFWSGEGDYWHHYESGLEVYVKGSTGSFSIIPQQNEQYYYECANLDQNGDFQKCDTYNDCIDVYEDLSSNGGISDLRKLACDGYDLYYYATNGDEFYQNTNLSISWQWTEKDETIRFTNNQTLPDGTKELVYFGGQDNTGFIQEKKSATSNDLIKYQVSYDPELKQWSFTDSTGRKFWYYEQFAWGNNEQTWYLRANFHDKYTLSKGFWP